MELTPEELAEAQAIVRSIDAAKRPDGYSALLRGKIEAAIRSNAGDPSAAAVAVCVTLEREMGLAGNGWFDGDDIVLEAIERD
jgi:hypothetical protein